MHGVAGSWVISCISAWQADERLATCFSEAAIVACNAGAMLPSAFHSSICHQKSLFYFASLEHLSSLFSPLLLVAYQARAHASVDRSGTDKRRRGCAEPVQARSLVLSELPTPCSVRRRPSQRTKQSVPELAPVLRLVNVASISHAHARTATAIIAFVTLHPRPPACMVAARAIGSGRPIGIKSYQS